MPNRGWLMSNRAAPQRSDEDDATYRRRLDRNAHSRRCKAPYVAECVEANRLWRQARPGWAAERARVYRKTNPVRAQYNITKQWDQIHGFEDGTLAFDDYLEVVAPMTCSYTGLQLRWDGGLRDDLSPSLDRIDNDRGHSIDNVVLSCLRVNLMRGNLPVEEFLRLCRLVSENAR